MTTIKSYTDLEQSKKLAEILPLYSADMFWVDDERPAVWNNKDVSLDETDTPAWSLAALFRELPDTMLGKDKDGCVVMVETMGSGLTTFASDPIDACVEMIIKLHK